MQYRAASIKLKVRISRIAVILYYTVSSVHQKAPTFTVVTETSLCSYWMIKQKPYLSFDVFKHHRLTYFPF